VHGNGSGGPLWMTILAAAKEWGVPPWEIDTQTDSKALWLMRWSYLQNQIAKKNESERATWRKN